jgi:SAM-dependent methyltransferase
VGKLTAPGNLAPQEFWEEDYYQGMELPLRPNPHYPAERCLIHALEELASVPRGAQVLELGCSPARWLVWYAERFGALVTGLESSPTGVTLSRENLSAAGVGGDIREGDFFRAEIGKFDLVLSLGFIEHFDDVPAAFARHVSFVKQGGRLVIGMPNFRGLIGFFQRWADPDYLAMHNRDAMDPSPYQRLAAQGGMRLDAVRFIGGLDPDMVRVSRLSARLALMPLRLWRKLRPSDHVNGRSISSYLVMTFTRL